jgi:hypothetical protein
MSTPVKHIHATVQNDDQLESGKVGMTLITLSYEPDGSKITESYDNFILPNEKSRIHRFVDDLYLSSNPPSNITKGDFKELIIDFTIALAGMGGKDLDKLNSYFSDWTNKPETQQQIEELLTKPGNKTFLGIEEETKAEEQKKQENMAIFEASQAQEGSDLDTDKDLAHHEGYDDEEDETEGIASTPEERLEQEQKELFGDKPTEGNQRPVVDLSGMSQEKTKVFANLPESSTVKFKGVGGARLIEPVPDPIYYPGDAYMKGENNAGIICSRDELYRFRGHTNSGAVYIYAGRNGSSKGEDTGIDNFTNPELTKKPVPNNLITDSAYIYISQKADVDSLYKYKVARGTYSKVISPLLPKGERETRKGISLASIKADDIVLMSRTSGIRLITGTDKKNSKGGDQNSKFGIDLIAGNDDSDLQPLVKGDNLVKYLTGLSKTVDELRSVFYDFMNSQSKFNNQVANHAHLDPFLIFLGTLGPKNPFGIDVASMFGTPNGRAKSPPSIELQQAGATALLETMRQQSNTVNLIMNQVGNDTNAFNAIGSYNILSTKNRTN